MEINTTTFNFCFIIVKILEIFLTFFKKSLTYIMIYAIIKTWKGGERQWQRKIKTASKTTSYKKSSYLPLYLNY